MSEGDDMQAPKANWATWNPWTILSQGVTVGSMLVLGGIAWGSLTSKVDGVPTKAEFRELAAQVEEMDRYRASRSATTDKKFDEIQLAIAPIANLTFNQTLMSNQIAEQKAQTSELSKRVDRVVELLSGKMDTVIETVNVVKSDVRVLTQEVKSLGGRSGTSNVPTSFRQP